MEPSAVAGTQARIDGREARLLLGLDFAGTYVFAVEGAIAAIAGGLDPLGIMVLSFATALGGGILRDLLIGATPPNSIRDERYAMVAFAGGATVLFLHRFVTYVPPLLLVTLDAAGLSLFAIAGARKALDFGLRPLMAVLMAAITGSGGGTLRDLFLNHVPTVLRADIYAVAALAGALVMVAGQRLGLPSRTMALVGGAACFALRMVSVWRGWSLPHFSLTGME
ncbi:trimeric intracellular cation channel family protein [Corallococcus carmarthensis]|uniref:trimeric intracellular cation channel family protein n=1 Tax=Corallococcus carmarthensis TaxID=2316728 RepID=UPI00148D0824|nr:trimeric intracellular cation channel family protein [Corallococcus carmarthensis]NOK18664.1 trimeric intracellular cation channel family protein [Corallococcus carmarthensis]